jgi:hypothetical protein
MEELIRLIEEKIKSLEEELLSLQSSMEDEVYKARDLEDILNDPDSIDEATFRPLFSEEFSSTIDEILSYKGWFSKSSNESQIIAVRAKLEELIDKKIREYSAKYVSIRENELKPKSITLSKYKDALNVLINYNSEDYIDLDKLEQIDSLIRLIEIPDEAVNLYLAIAINNIRNIKQAKATEKTSKELSEEKIQEMDEARDNKFLTEKDVQEKISERDIVIERLNKFLNVEKKEKPSYVDVYKMIGPKLYSLSKKIIASIKDVIDRKSKFKSSENAVDFAVLKEYIAMAGLDDSLEKDYFDAAVLVELLDAYETKDVEKIKKVIKSYKKRIDVDIQEMQERALQEEIKAKEIAEREEQRAREEQELEAAILEEEKTKQETSSEEFKPLPEFDAYAKLLKEVDDKCKIRTFLKSNKDVLESLEGLDKSDIKRAFPVEDDYYKCIMANYYAAISTILKSRENNPEIVQKLTDLKAELDSTIKEYEDFIEANKTTLESLKESGKPFNYIVLFDESEFDRTFDREKRLAPIKKSEFPKEVYDIIMQLIFETDQNEIRKRLHNIKKGNKDNTDNICDYPAKTNKKMRVTVKILEDVHLAGEDENEKHNVIVIFHNVYAKRQKNDELQETLATFGVSQERYKELQRIFGPEGTKEEQEREIAKGFSVVDKLKRQLTGGNTYD